MPPELLIVGYDTRMLSEKFAQAAAELIAANGIPVELVTRDVPSPVLSAAILDRGADGGISFTASHNPPEYNGLKLYLKEGILAPAEVTNPIEKRFAELEGSWDDTFLPAPELIVAYDPKPDYLKKLGQLIDWDAIRESGMHIAVDPLFGTSREYLDFILIEHGIPIEVIHNTRDPFFGGYAPECTSENLARLREVMRRSGANLGLATDGDADRFGVLDRGARLADASLAIALILDYLARRRGLKGGVGRTLATSHVIDAVAERHGLELIETSVGFRNFGPLLVDGTLEFAGEESAGLAWSKHLPERDGIFACLLTAEMVAVEGRPLTELKQDLFRRIGTFHFRRTQVPLTKQIAQLFTKRMKQQWKTIEGRKIVAVDRSDGLKLSFEGGSWILARAAGTEPKLRLYAEGHTREEMRHLMYLARQLFTNWRQKNV